MATELFFYNTLGYMCFIVQCKYFRICDLHYIHFKGLNGLEMDHSIPKLLRELMDLNN